jgi:hypothetical protein
MATAGVVGWSVLAEIGGEKLCVVLQMLSFINFHPSDLSLFLSQLSDTSFDFTVLIVIIYNSSSDVSCE